MTEKTFFFLLVVALIAAGVIWYLHMATANALQAARITVIDFGQALQTVSISAADSIASPEIAQNYGPYVDPALLTLWEQNPAVAPGRVTSSPWPDHVVITSLTEDGIGGYHVQGNVIELTSQDIVAGTDSGEVPFVATVSKVNGKWMISAWQGLAG